MQTTCHDCCQPWASSSGKTYSSLAITSWWNRSWKNDTEEEYLTNVQRSLSTVRLITFCSQVAFQFFMLSLLGELTGNGLNCIVNGPNNKVSKWLGWKIFSSSMPAWLIGCYIPLRCRWVKLPELSSVCIPMQLVRSLHTGNWRLVEPHKTCWTTCWQWCMFIFLYGLTTCRHWIWLSLRRGLSQWQILRSRCLACLSSMRGPLWWPWRFALNCLQCAILHVIPSAPPCFKQIKAGRRVSAHMPATLFVGTLGCLSKSMVHKMFNKEKSICGTLGSYPGAECMLLMGVNLEDMDFEMHFSNSDPCLQAIWNLLRIESSHPLPLTCN